MTTATDTSLQGMLSRLQSEKDARDHASAKAKASATPATQSLADLVQGIHTEREERYALMAKASPDAAKQYEKFKAPAKKPVKPMFLSWSQIAVWVFVTLVAFYAVLRFDQALRANSCHGRVDSSESCSPTPFQKIDPFQN